jgi:hypothetical protein
MVLWCILEHVWEIVGVFGDIAKEDVSDREAS